MSINRRGFWMQTGLRHLALVALLLGAATPVLASPCVPTGTDRVDQTASQTPPTPQTQPARPATKDDPHGPLGMVGWTYSSIIRNGAVANINFSRGKPVPNEDAVAWRGLQLTGTVGSRGSEIGAGYARMTVAAQFPIGYEFRGLAGRTWKDSGSLVSGDVYTGGEATFMLAVLRFTAGVVVPISSGASHRPVLTGSVGIVLFLTKWTQADRKGPARAR